MISLRSPRLDEAAILTSLCVRSKAVWGYDKAFIEACRPELTITPLAMQSPHMQVAEINGFLTGLAQITIKGSTADLDKLFVEPGYLRCGVGRALFGWAKKMALQAGATTLVVESDPGAVDFYRHMGAIDDGIAASGSIPGRFVPRLKVAL